MEHVISKVILLLTVIFTILLFAGFPQAQVALGIDENFGLGLSELSVGRVENAKDYFKLSQSPNANAILNYIDTGFDRDSYPDLDPTDPTLLAFYDYVVELSKKWEYAFFQPVVEQLQHRLSNREQDTLGLFYNAYFSPKSSFLTVYASDRTFVLDTETGTVVQFHVAKHMSTAEIHFSGDEREMLKVLGSSFEEEGKTWLEYYDVASRRMLWRCSYTHRVSAAFKKDYKVIVVYNYKAGYETTALDVYELKLSTGKELSHQRFRNLEWDSIKEKFSAGVACAVELFHDDAQCQSYIESSDRRYLFVGTPNCMEFELRHQKSGKTIKKLVFASRVE